MARAVFLLLLSPFTFILPNKFVNHRLRDNFAYTLLVKSLKPAVGCLFSLSVSNHSLLPQASAAHPLLSLWFYCL